MPRRNKQSALNITSKGLIIWGVLFFFIAGWMFVLGILVGRGMAPISMKENRFEQEIAALKEALKKKENEQMPKEIDLEYPEKLIGNNPPDDLKPDDLKIDQSMIDRKTGESDVNTKPAIPKQNTSEKAVPQQESKTGSAGNYTIQVASYKNATYARHLVNQLKKKGFTTFLSPKASGGGKSVMYRVRVGAYNSLREVEVEMARLKSQQYNDCLVVSTK